MAKLLILYSTTDGHTIKICQKIQGVVEEHGHQVEIYEITDADQVDLAQFDKILIGASIRYGKHNKKVFEFIERNQDILNSKPSAFFSVNVVARKPEKNQPDTNPYLQKFLQQVPWQPDQLGVFAGKIDYQRYSVFDRMMIRFIMLITKGPTDPQTVAEFTNWQAVEEFGEALSEIRND